jgi:hypothetical protein
MPHRSEAVSASPWPGWNLHDNNSRQWLDDEKGSKLGPRGWASLVPVGLGDHWIRWERG